MTPVRGRFITMEGTEGAGKSTNLDFVRELLADSGKDVLVTREPGGTPLAEEVRQLLLEHREEAVDAVAEALLVFAARAQHVATVIEPALRTGRWVLCDRFTDSTFAYQGGGRGVRTALLQGLADQVHGACWPDLTLYLDVPATVAGVRIANRSQDRFEAERADFFERVRDVYRQRARRHARIVQIAADRDLRLVRKDIAAAVERFLVPP